MRKLNADPEFKAATAERMRKLHADPEFKAKVRAGIEKTRWHCPPGFESLYQKARHILGVKAARAQIEAMPRDEAARATGSLTNQERVHAAS